LRNKIIIRHEYGQLGNILFRLSNALAYALEFDYKVEDYTLAFCNYHDGSSNIRFFENYYTLHFFEYPRPKSRLINRLKWKFREKNYRNNKTVENFEPSFDLTDLPPYSNYELMGFHFTAKELVNKHQDDICKILEFSRMVKDSVNQLHKEARSQYPLLLGVHIRANDFKEFYNGRYYVETSKYLDLVDQFVTFQQSNHSVGIVVVSDSLEVLQKLKVEKSTYIIHHGSAAEDMYLLSMCDYLLGPMASTFSAWAAFIGKIPIFQIDQRSNLSNENDFKPVSQLEPFNLT